jgi:hypothetical protein
VSPVGATRGTSRARAVCTLNDFFGFYSLSSLIIPPNHHFAEVTSHLIKIETTINIAEVTSHLIKVETTINIS